MNDLEHLEHNTNKEIYVTYVLLGVLRGIPDKVKEGEKYEEVIIRNLKFKNIGDDKRMRSFIDLIEDTELAIIDFFTHGLTLRDESYMQNLSEQYLRLYGVLNAFYLQKEAIIGLIELCNLPDKKKWDKEFKDLKIHDIRNKLAAHTANFLYDISSNKTTSFKLVRVSLSKWAERLSIVSDLGGVEYVNLIEIFKPYNELSENLLKNICRKALKSLFPNNSEFKEWMMEHYRYAENRTFDYETLRYSLDK